MSILRFKSESDIPTKLHARVRSPEAGIAAAWAAQGVSGEVERSPAQAIGSGTDEDVVGAESGSLMLPWPPKELSPNARSHWAVKSKAAKAYRAEGAWLTHKAGLVVDWPGLVYAWITFYPPNRRHYDDDNLVAAFKACRDGIADALSINDKRFRIRPWLSDEVVKGGAVKVRLSPGPEA